MAQCRCELLACHAANEAGVQQSQPGRRAHLHGARTIATSLRAPQHHLGVSLAVSHGRRREGACRKAGNKRQMPCGIRLRAGLRVIGILFKRELARTRAILTRLLTSILSRNFCHAPLPNELVLLLPEWRDLPGSAGSPRCFGKPTVELGDLLRAFAYQVSHPPKPKSLGGFRARCA